MKARTLLKLASLALSLLFSLATLGALLAVASASSQPELLAFLAMAIQMAAFAGAFLAYPFWPRVAKVLGVLALVMLSLSVLAAVFTPEMSRADPGIYQIGAIALLVLLLARIVLSLRKRRQN